MLRKGDGFRFSGLLHQVASTRRVTPDRSSPQADISAALPCTPGWSLLVRCLEKLWLMNEPSTLKRKTVSHIVHLYLLNN